MRRRFRFGLTFWSCDLPQCGISTAMSSPCALQVLDRMQRTLGADAVPTITVSVNHALCLSRDGHHREVRPHEFTPEPLTSGATVSLIVRFASLRFACTTACAAVGTLCEERPLTRSRDACSTPCSSALHTCTRSAAARCNRQQHANAIDRCTHRSPQYRRHCCCCAFCRATVRTANKHCTKHFGRRSLSPRLFCLHSNGSICRPSRCASMHSSGSTACSAESIP